MRRCRRRRPRKKMDSHFNYFIICVCLWKCEREHKRTPPRKFTHSSFSHQVNLQQTNWSYFYRLNKTETYFFLWFKARKKVMCCNDTFVSECVSYLYNKSSRLNTNFIGLLKNLSPIKTNTHERNFASVTWRSHTHTHSFAVPSSPYLSDDDDDDVFFSFIYWGMLSFSVKLNCQLDIHTRKQHWVL